MEFKKEEERILWEPVSPIGQYFNSSSLSIAILSVLEYDVPIDDSQSMSLLNDVFLPINPRFSSIMVMDDNGVKKWKKVEVKLKDHVNVPIFPPGMSPEFYDNYLGDYFAKIAMEQFPQSQPLWEIHIIKYPTTNAAGTLIFKLHHALGDGISLMGALLSCLQRADNPSLPLTFPSVQPRPRKDSDMISNSMLKTVPKIFSLVFNSVSDFWSSVLKSSLVEDDQSPIRSADVGVEFRPITISTMTFSLDHIKQIKANLGDVTINDVIVGIIFLGTRLYMQAMSQESSNTNSTALVLLNTRMFQSYNSVKQMVKPNAKTPWGNHFAFLHVPIPKLTDDEASNPLEFISKAHKIIGSKKSSFAIHLTARLLEIIKKFRGSEAAARYVHDTLKNSSMAITNVVGPVEQMALANQPIRGLYFMVVGNPQNLTATIVSYMGKLRVAIGAEKDFIDSQKLKSCIEKAFEMILKVAREAPSKST